MTHYAARCGCKLCVVQLGCGEEVLPAPACVRGEGEGKGKGKGKEGSVMCAVLRSPKAGLGPSVCNLCFPPRGERSASVLWWGEWVCVPVLGLGYVLSVSVFSVCITTNPSPQLWSKTFWLAPCAPFSSAPPTLLSASFVRDVFVPRCCGFCVLVRRNVVPRACARPLCASLASANSVLTCRLLLPVTVCALQIREETIFWEAPLCVHLL